MSEILVSELKFLFFITHIQRWAL